MAESVHEAWEQVERGALTEADFRDFTFTSVVRLHRGMNPDFFEGTSVESPVRQVVYLLRRCGRTVPPQRRKVGFGMPIHYETVDPHVVLVTIDRPDRKNALDFEHFGDLALAWRRFKEDDDAWVAILTGVGDSYCAGADLRDLVPMFGEIAERVARGETEMDGRPLTAGTDAVFRSFQVYKPIIAAVNGPCVAGGMEMLGGIDIRIACPEAVFGVMEPRRGLFAGGGTTARLPRQLGWPAAMEFLLTAEGLPAQRALELGLINEIVPREQLVERAREWARRITVNAPLAIQGTKESALRCFAAGSLDEAYAIESEISKLVFATEDAKEGPRAFVEKRPPNWQGK